MPDGPAGGGEAEKEHATAGERVEARLRALGGELRALEPAELAAYRERRLVCGWRLPVQFSDGVRRIDLLLPAGFPWEAAMVALVDRPPFLTWPHVERDGVLCVAGEHAAVDPDDPGGSAMRYVGWATELVESLGRGERAADFLDEFLTYWRHAVTATGTAVISLIEPAPPSRVVRVWRGSGAWLVGESENAIDAWITNRLGGRPKGFSPDEAVFLWLGEAIPPQCYPNSANELRARARVAQGEDGRLLDELAGAAPRKLLALLGVSTASGPALAACILTEPPAPASGPREPLTRGFRPGRVPPEILTGRYYGSAKLTRTSVERADAAWIHGRGQDERADRLRGMAVAVVGCGSIGASVAIGLVQAGVGRLALIDFDKLSWANIGRHSLGARCVGESKVKGLTEKLRADYPHVAVEPYAVKVDEVIRERPETLRGCDLIVSATGSWGADACLDDWHRSMQRAMPILYGWTEAHACAGHAVLISGQTGCLRCGFDATGLPSFRVTAWPEAATVHREPACGGIYQPYGPVELGFIVSLISELALDALLGATKGTTHRIWATTQKRLQALNGQWTPEWEAFAAGHLDGGLIRERPWANAAGCPQCARAIAA